jgi:DNA-binding transcriptional regulator of glucitol operon
MSRTTRRMIERHPAYTEQTEGAADSISEVSKPAISLEAASALLAEALDHERQTGKADAAAHRAQRSFQQLGETGLANRPATSPVFASPVLANDVHQRLVAESVYHARRLGKLTPQGAVALFAPVNGVFTLAQWQSPFKAQNDRGTCWAFAGAAALEAAYRRKFNLAIDVSEEYVFHMGKAFALNKDPNGVVATPVENNSSLYGFQGCGDIVKKLSENAVAPEWSAPYAQTQGDLVGILPTLGLPSLLAVDTQEDYDAVEFCEQHIPLLARVNARYRATGWKSLGANPSVEALENTLLAEHEVVCDVQTPLGGHVLLLIGFDRNRKVFFAKNSWGENRFIEIQYANDPNWTILSGWYIEDVADPTFVQNEACWLGNWWVTQGNTTFRLLLRRSEDFVAPGTATKVGTAYLGDGAHDVNGFFLNNGSHLRFFIAPTTLPETPGTLVGTQFDAHLNFQDIYNAAGAGGGQRVTMSRFATRFAAIFEEDDGTPWQARHGVDADTYQATFDSLAQEGYRLTNLCGYSEGTGARFNATWQLRGGPAWEARHGLNASHYQATFDSLVQQGYRLTCISGYAENGEARYAAIWELRDGPAWQARHGLNRAQYQQAFDEMAAKGYVLTQVCGYRVNVDVLFAAIWEKQEGVEWQARHGLTANAYQQTFDQQAAVGMRLACVSGYSDTGIARHAAIWRREPAGQWQARHGLDADGYQQVFDELRRHGLRPVMVSGYGDGFYPA